MKVLHVLWHDSTHASGWQSMRAIRRTNFDRRLDIVTVGFLVKQTARYIVLAQNANPDDDLAGDLMTIPREQVREIRELS